jgi:NAD(P)-dependent dehydrogenase (short-subunit alcohol dehydrogenase family)
MVEGFAAAGANVVLVSRKETAVQAAADEVSDRHGVKVLGIAANVGSWSGMQAVHDEAYAGFGRIDVLVNNVGMSPLYGSLPDVTEELFAKVIDVNLRSTFRLSALIGTRMVDDGGGSILNVSSAAASRPRPAMLPYAAAKAGVNVITLGMAEAFAPTVRVNGIVAGPFETDVARHWTDGDIAEAVEGQALGRLGRPEEVVGAALYLCGTDASFTTGALLDVHGGLR